MICKNTKHCFCVFILFSFFLLMLMPGIQSFAVDRGPYDRASLVGSYQSSSKIKKITYNEFTKAVKEKRVKVVDYSYNAPYLTGKFKDNKDFKTDNPQILNFKEYLLINDVKVNQIASGSAFGSYFMLIFYVFLAIMLFRVLGKLPGGMGMGSNRAMNIVKKTDKESNEKVTTFENVAGCAEAKENMDEIVDFLKFPEKYEKYGVKVPKGTILYGPPGTGKTLLARALAGEAGAQFLYASGSDFVEKYVGVGASRVRELFSHAKRISPCIIFIDELDAVGKHRGASEGGNDEREQTLNQILVELDGFSDNKNGVIVVSATNRLDSLDSALLRSGRFDRQIYVGLPDLNARHEILKVHAANKPISSDVDLRQIAETTLYMSGADLENIMNEAGIYAARNNAEFIEPRHITLAINKLIAGDEKKDRTLITHRDREITAFHEAGHALVAKVLAKQSVPKVTIVPTTKGAGGYAIIAPKERMYKNKTEMIAEVAVSLAGRASEELIFGKDFITGGASSDLRNATSTVMHMIKSLGMSETFGLVSFESSQGNEKLLLEAKAMLDDIYEKAKSVISDNICALYGIANALLDNETIFEKEIDDILDIESQKK